MLNQINILRATGVLPQSVNYAVKSDYILPVVSGKMSIKLATNSTIDKKEMSQLVDSSEKSVVLVIAE